jgi:hypothetical protein
MKILVVGARKYQDRQSVIDLVMSLPAEATIITSSCKGVCTWVEEVAEGRGIKVSVFSPDLSNIRAWFDIPKRYYQRNKEMVGACDLLYAFISAEDGFIGNMGLRNGFFSIPSRFLSKNRPFCCPGRSFSVKYVLSWEVHDEVVNLWYLDRFGR